jgi:hypothetical protein
MKESELVAYLESHLCRTLHDRDGRLHCGCGDPQLFLDQAHDFAGLCMAAHRLLAEYEDVARHHFKTTAARRDQRQAGNGWRKAFQ